MQLLVSVADADEAAAAIAGGAHIVDAKDPARGAMGAVDPQALAAIRARVGLRAPLSAALGDAASEAQIEADVTRCAGLGIAFVKIGFAGVASLARVERLAAAAQRATPCSVVLVAYADAGRVGAPDPEALLDVAARSGAGVLLDTADKAGPGLIDLFTPIGLAEWAARAHRMGLQVALAGRLTRDDLARARDAGADIAGVRGAACEGGRRGRVSSAKVRELVDLVGGDDGRLDLGGERAPEPPVHQIAG